MSGGFGVLAWTVFFYVLWCMASALVVCWSHLSGIRVAMGADEHDDISGHRTWFEGWSAPMVAVMWGLIQTLMSLVFVGMGYISSLQLPVYPWLNWIVMVVAVGLTVAIFRHSHNRWIEREGFGERYGPSPLWSDRF